MKKDGRSRLEDLRDLIRALRGEKGCPWDREQTPHTIKAYLLEETYEALDALERGDHEELCSELGDLLFQLLFMVQLFEEKNRFTWEEVIESVLQKMIRRHPHVFGEAEVSDAEEVKKNWALIKARERKENGGKNSLDSIPVDLPALLRAHRVGERASKVGFDWNDAAEAMPKVEEEWAEFKKVLRMEKPDPHELADELGDLFFSLVNVARLLNINAEFALQGTIRKFIERFSLVSKEVTSRGGTMEDASLEEMDSIWEHVKQNRKSLHKDKGHFLENIQNKLGYRFQSIHFLETALCHRSFAHEHPELGLKDNERLEFLGDALLDLIISNQLYQRFPEASEGELTRWRSNLVNEAGLSQVAQSIELGQALFLGAGEEGSGGREKNSILANAMEALLAAIYLDGGISAARETVSLLFGHLLDQAARTDTATDFKTRLQELTQGRHKIVPQYHIVEATGPDHDRTFVVSLTLKGSEVARGRGKSKKEATQDAARLALEKIENHEEFM